jgi:hypothetical protein
MLARSLELGDGIFMAGGDSPAATDAEIAATPT